MFSRPISTTAGGAPPVAPARLEVPFRSLYPWVFVVAALDVMMTCAVLEAGGVEMNPIADYVLQRAGSFGLLLQKLACLLVVLAAIELLSMRRARLARMLAVVWTAAWTFPPLFALLQIWQWI